MKEKRFKIDSRVYTATTEKHVRRLRELARQHGHTMTLIRRPYKPEKEYTAVFPRGRIVRIRAKSLINARVRLIGCGYNLRRLVALTMTEDE